MQKIKTLVETQEKTKTKSLMKLPYEESSSSNIRKYIHKMCVLCYNIRFLTCICANSLLKSLGFIIPKLSHRPFWFRSLQNPIYSQENIGNKTQCKSSILHFVKL
uniref:Uncharacterized protein n=1 Tax=Pyxicephalus adspersus TaxID=30357 RepID=A0AAV2ZNI8_PYXAD|nr:TPA: hypothetical protein GDO54_003430 [Pyxicephalus adspersus]